MFCEQAHQHPAPSPSSYSCTPPHSTLMNLSVAPEFYWRRPRHVLPVSPIAPAYPSRYSCCTSRQRPTATAAGPETIQGREEGEGRSLRTHLRGVVVGEGKVRSPEVVLELPRGI